jgi:hypothetical protein
MDEKIAVVLHGIVGGMSERNGEGDPVDIVSCYKTIDYSILSNYDCDIFAHSWSIEHEESIVSLYKPKSYSFQPQENFGYFAEKASSIGDIGQAYRIVSKYTSLKRAMELKCRVEEENNFIYKWVVVLRFDLIFFTKLDLSILNPNNFYVCLEPYWTEPHTLMHDIVFVSSSSIMDKYTTLVDDIHKGLYDPSVAHETAYNKARDILDGDISRMVYGFHRYKDVEIYRMIMHPELNPLGHKNGALETKARMEILLKSLMEVHVE